MAPILCLDHNYDGGDPLPNVGIGARKFRTHIPEMGDRSVWTDTPADKRRKAEVRRWVGKWVDRLAGRGGWTVLTFGEL